MGISTKEAKVLNYTRQPGVSIGVTYMLKNKGIKFYCEDRKHLRDANIFISSLAGATSNPRDLAKQNKKEGVFAQGTTKGKTAPVCVCLCVCKRACVCVWNDWGDVR